MYRPGGTVANALKRIQEKSYVLLAIDSAAGMVLFASADST